MKEPTEEEKKRLWEWCGIEIEKFIDGIPQEFTGETKEGRKYLAHPIDPNNLFEYAVPKLPSLDCIRFGTNPDGWSCEVISVRDMYSMNGQGETPALALFWAIYKVIEGE